MYKTVFLSTDPVLSPTLPVHFSCSTHAIGLLTSSDFDSGSVEVKDEAELWVSAGRAYAVPVSIPRVGSTFRWRFTTYPKVTQHNEAIIGVCSLRLRAEFVLCRISTCRLSTAKAPCLKTTKYSKRSFRCSSATRTKNLSAVNSSRTNPAFTPSSSTTNTHGAYSFCIMGI